MQFVRPILAANPRLFGRGPAREIEPPDEPAMRLSDDLKLFAVTFLAGFLFVSIFIA